MYFYLVNSLKRRLIFELRDSFSKHPLYEKIVPFIQNKFSFTERPQFGIIVKGASSNNVKLSADNFMGTIESHVMLAYVGQPVFPLEWIREDLAAVRANNDRMPTPAGVYYLEILTAPTNPTESGGYVLDPLLTVSDEAVLRFQSGVEREAQLQQIPIPNTLRLWQNRRFLLAEGTDYEANYKTGAITLKGDGFPPNAIVTADYRYAGQSIGPLPWYWNTADFNTLPGVVLAFGKRGKAKDKVAIVVYPDRVATANAYGGKHELSFELDVVSQDADQMEEIADLATMYMWAEKRPALSFEGIEMTDVSMGGEAEESYDETADLNYYTASLTMAFTVDWEVHIPMSLTISKVAPTGGNFADGSIESSLYFATAPNSPGRNNNFERIK